MKSLAETPTEPVNYATITATYGALLGTLVVAARRRGDTEVIVGGELVPLGLAAFALSKLLGKEKVESWLREPFVEEGPEGSTPRGTGMRYAVGELLTCTRCLGAWSALGLVALRLQAPAPGRAAVAVLAVSGINDFLQTGFNYTRGKANEVPA